MTSILLYPDGIHGTHGYVKYGGSRYGLECHFLSDKSSDIMRWKLVQPVSSLCDLPSEALGRICSYAATSDGTLRISFDSPRSLSFDRSIFDFSLEYRRLFVRELCYSRPLVIEMLAASSVTDFNEFVSLRECYPKGTLRESYLIPLISHIIKSSSTSRCLSATVQLTLSPAQPSNMENIRIKINGLLNLLHAPGGTAPHLPDRFLRAFFLRNGGSDLARCERNQITVARLKMNIFLYFTDLLDQLPQDEYPVVPSLWINGHGCLVDKILPPAGFWYTEVYGRTLKHPMQDINIQCSAYHHGRDGQCSQGEHCMYCAWHRLYKWAKTFWRNERREKQRSLRRATDN